MTIMQSARPSISDRRFTLATDLDGTFLGGTTAPVATYASPIPFADHPDRAIDAARALLGIGFTALKMKIGRDLATDLDHNETRTAHHDGNRV